MYNTKVPDNRKPTILTAKHYDIKISVEFEYSDVSLDEVMDGFQTLLLGMGYHTDGFKQWVMERADEYREEDFNERYSFDNSLQSERDSETFFDAITNPPHPTEAAMKAVENYVNSLSESDIDEAFAQHNADEEGIEFDDYGSKITKRKKK
jgi:hypothetical protein